jgi:hypothetical protein
MNAWTWLARGSPVRASLLAKRCSDSEPLALLHGAQTMAWLSGVRPVRLRSGLDVVAGGPAVGADHGRRTERHSAATSTDDAVSGTLLSRSARPQDGGAGRCVRPLQHRKIGLAGSARGRPGGAAGAAQSRQCGGGQLRPGLGEAIARALPHGRQLRPAPRRPGKRLHPNASTTPSPSPRLRFSNVACGIHERLWEDCDGDKDHNGCWHLNGRCNHRLCFRSGAATSQCGYRADRGTTPYLLRRRCLGH